MTAIGFLCQIAAQGTKICAAPYRDDPNYNALVRHGLLTEASVVSSVSCADCGQPHDAELVHNGATYGYCCPELGFVPLVDGDVQAASANLPALVARLANLYTCKRRGSQSLVGNTWRIGTVESEGGDIALYFQPRLRDEADLHRIQDALAREVAAPFRIILTAEGGAPLAGAHVVPLSEIVEIEASTGELQSLMSLHAVVGAPIKSLGGAPNRYRAKVMDLIQSRVSSGVALAGSNEEARAIASTFQRKHPADKVPSLPTIKRYLSEVRSGS